MRYEDAIRKRFLEQSEDKDIVYDGGKNIRTFVCGWRTSSTDEDAREFFMMDYTGERIKLLSYKDGDTSITVRSGCTSYINHNNELMHEMITTFNDYLSANGRAAKLATA